MITLYFAPRTRAVRVRWLLEELGLPHELRRVPFQPPKKVFAQDTPLGKFPAIDAADVMMGFTLVAARVLGVLDDRYPELTRYLASLESRPAFRTAAEA